MRAYGALAAVLGSGCWDPLMSAFICLGAIVAAIDGLRLLYAHPEYKRHLGSHVRGVWIAGVFAIVLGLRWPLLAARFYLFGPPARQPPPAAAPAR